MVVQIPFDTLIAPYLQSPVAAPLLDMNFGFARARILDTALELRLFTVIARRRETTSSELAVATDCDEQGLRHLLDALVGLELLHRDNEHYHLSQSAQTYLVEGEPGYIGSHLCAVMKQWETWGDLTQVVRSGRRAPREDWGDLQVRGCDPAMFAHVFPIVFPLAWQVAGQFEQPLRGRVLDMFAGSGAWGISIALRHPEVEVVAQDEPALLETVHAGVKHFNLEERFTLRERESDACSFEPESFRLIIVAHASRFVGAQRSQQLLRDCYRLLQPGGKLLLVDIIANDERTAPTAALVIQLSLFLNTLAGDVFTVAQYRSWLHAAGFEHVKDMRIGHLPFLLASR